MRGELFTLKFFLPKIMIGSRGGDSRGGGGSRGSGSGARRVSSVTGAQRT